ncbi:MAG: putative effector of murein hydrolase, partial [Kiritimatiellia bacterium]
MYSSDLLATPLSALLVTIGSYSVALWFQKKLRGNSYCNPAVVAILLVVMYLFFFNVPYEKYLQGVNFINTLLGTATVALAIPLYDQIYAIKGSTKAIVLSIVSTCIIAAISSYFL